MKHTLFALEPQTATALAPMSGGRQRMRRVDAGVVAWGADSYAYAKTFSKMKVETFGADLLPKRSDPSKTACSNAGDLFQSDRLAPAEDFAIRTTDGELNNI